ncbi:hypothetical protein LCGC14_2018760 [marine sediment metagenome]|uniref:Uncharacterized protein n=1 Tax=marine sediment metagenome TaxID=412755 RepID=A0A0F9EY68_9ZZZZ
MKRTKKIHNKNLPPRIPLFPGITIWLLLDRINAPGWAWGAAGLFFLLLLIVSTAEFFTSKLTDIFEDKKE